MLGIIESRLSGFRVVFVAGEFPLVRRSCLVPSFAKREVPERAHNASGLVCLCAVGEMIGMMVGGAAPGSGGQQFGSCVDVFLAQAAVHVFNNQLSSRVN